MKTPNRRLNIYEAAAYVHRSPRTIRNWMATGNHPKYEKERGRLYFWTHDLDAFMSVGKEIHDANIRDWNKRAS